MEYFKTCCGYDITIKDKHTATRKLDFKEYETFIKSITPDYFIDKCLKLEELLWEASGGDITKFDQLKKIDATEFWKLMVIKDKKAYLKWYADAIQIEETKNTGQRKDIEHG